jgi:hypothetical protein
LINKNDIKIVLYIITFSKMSTISSRIISIYKSRTTLLEQLQKQGYNVDDYSSFTINEIDSMLSNSQLDMLINHSDNDIKIYIKYYFTLKQTTKQIKKEVYFNGYYRR